MDIGMLWYDDDEKRTVGEKVSRAANYYRVKYGAAPTDCFVHPSMTVDGKDTVVAGVRLHPNRHVVKNHFWLGFAE